MLRKVDAARARLPARGALAGEEVPSECLLWQPIVRDREPNHHVPAFRRGVTWPPTGDRMLELAAR